MLSKLLGLTALILLSGMVFAAGSDITQLGKDNWPLTVAPFRTGDLALPAPGMPTQYLYVTSEATPTPDGNLCDKSATGIRTYDISNPKSPKFISLTNAPQGTFPHALKQVRLASGKNILLAVNSICAFTTADGKNIASNAAQINNGTLSGFDVYDLSDPKNPKLMSTNNLQGIAGAEGADIFVQNSTTYALVSTSGPNSPNSFFIFDMNNPKKPALVREISAVANGHLVWPVVVNGFSQDLSGGVPTIKQIGTRQIAFLPIGSGGVVLYDLTDIVGAKTNAERFISQIPLPTVDPISNLSPHDAISVALSEDGKYAAEFEYGINTRLNMHYGSSTPLPAVVEGALTQPIQSGESFITVRIPGGTASGLSDACGAVSPAGSTNQMAVISRGTCTFAEKANNVAAAGYGGMVVTNSQPLSGAIGMGGGLRTDAFRSVMISFESGSNPTLVPSGQLVTFDTVAIPFGYTRLWDLSDVSQPKMIVNAITTANTTYALPTNAGVSFTHAAGVLEVANNQGRLILPAGSDGFAIFSLKNLNTSPVVTQIRGTGLLPIDTGLVSPNEFLTQQVIVDYLHANNQFGAVDIAYTVVLFPYTVNGLKVLVGTSEELGIAVYADPPKK